ECIYSARFCAISGFIPNFFMYLFTHSSQDFPLLVLPFAFTLTLRQARTQSSPSMRSTCPNHLNLPLLTTSSSSITHSLPRHEIKSTLFSLSVNFTPHIHTIALSVCSNL